MTTLVHIGDVSGTSAMHLVRSLPAAAACSAAVGRTQKYEGRRERVYSFDNAKQAAPAACCCLVCAPSGVVYTP